MLFNLSRIAMLIALSFLLVACDGGSDEADTTMDTDTGTDTESTTTTTDASDGGYSSSEGMFSVTFPSNMDDPQEQTQQVPTEIGKIDMTMVMTTNANSVAMVAYAQYPDQAFDPGKTKDVLDGAQNGALTNMNGTADSQEDITVEGHPGRSIYFTGSAPNNQAAYGRVDMILAKPFFYQVLYASDNKADLEEIPVKTFFSSFDIQIEEAADDAGGEDTSDAE
jgi:hypothetical protein